MSNKTTLPDSLVAAQSKYRDDRRKLPGTVIPKDVLAELSRVQSENGLEKLSPALWHVVREHAKAHGRY